MSVAQDVYREITLTRPACGNEVPYAHYVATDKIGEQNSVFGKYHARLIKTHVVYHPHGFSSLSDAGKGSGSDDIFNCGRWRVDGVCAGETTEDNPCAVIEWMVDGVCAGDTCGCEQWKVSSPSEITSGYSPGESTYEDSLAFDEKLRLLVGGKPFFVHLDDELLCSFELDTLCLEECDFLHPQKNYQRVLLDVRSDSAINEVAYNFHFPNDVCAEGEYPDGFAVLYESNQGKLPNLPQVIEIEVADTPDVDMLDVPEELLLQGKNIVTVQVQEEIDIDCCVSGVESPFDNSYQIIVQAPLGSFGIDMRVMSEHAVQIHRYWLTL